MNEKSNFCCQKGAIFLEQDLVFLDITRLTAEVGEKQNHHLWNISGPVSEQFVLFRALLYW